MQTLTAAELNTWLNDPKRPAPFLLDVREAWEVALAKIADSNPIPLAEVVQHSATLPRNVPIVCICHHGMRSARAGHLLEMQGLTQVFNLQGGIDVWAREIDKTMQTY